MKEERGEQMHEKRAGNGAWRTVLLFMLLAAVVFFWGCRITLVYVDEFAGRKRIRVTYDSEGFTLFLGYDQSLDVVGGKVTMDMGASFDQACEPTIWIFGEYQSETDAVDLDMLTGSILFQDGGKVIFEAETANSYGFLVLKTVLGNDADISTYAQQAIDWIKAHAWE